MHDLEAGIGKQQRIGICKTDVLGCGNAQTAGNEKGILSSIKHPSQIIDSSIGIRPSDGLDESRDDIVVHFTILVISSHIFLNTARNQLVVNHNRSTLMRSGINRNLKNIQEFPPVTSAVAEQGLFLGNLDVLFLKQDIFLQGTA